MNKEREIELSTTIQKSLKDLRKRLGSEIDANALPEAVLSAARARRWDVFAIETARDELVEACRHWVANLVNRYPEHGCLTYDDLKQAGVMGLMKGALRYKGDRAKWSTYATAWIRQSIMRCIRSESRIIRIPEWALCQLRMHRLDEAEVERIKKLTHLRELIPKEIGKIEEPDIPLDVTGELKKLLTPREQFVIMSRFELGGRIHRTLKELGEILGLSRERVRQVQKAALMKLEQSKILREEYDHRI